MKRFAFLVHPRDVEDVARCAPRAAGKRPELVARILEWLPPYHLSGITRVRSRATGEEIGGEFVTFPLLPRQIVTLDRRDVVERLVAAGRLAEERGGSGKILASRLGIPVTSGSCCTVSTALEATARLAELMDLDLSRARVAVLGATGSIGAVCARELARQVGQLTLLARSRSRLEVLVKRIHASGRSAVGVEMDLERGIREADVVVSATSSGGGLIRPEWLRPGVLVIEGSIVEAPGECDLGFDIGYPPGLCMACMTETMALTLEGRFESFSIGRGLEYEDVVEITRIATRHGFRLAGFRSFGTPVTQERLLEAREMARRARRGLQVVPREAVSP